MRLKPGMEAAVRQRRVEILMAGDGDDGMNEETAVATMTEESLDLIMLIDGDHIRETNPEFFTDADQCFEITIKVNVRINDADYSVANEQLLSWARELISVEYDTDHAGPVPAEAGIDAVCGFSSWVDSVKSLPDESN